ncbi:hypothetical protein DL768_010279 [Monosporascus sp. mg162]|nr:hypothetical protein DL768_010279 [Monosporascus sp. mg162]
MASRLIKQELESQYIDVDKLASKLAVLFPGVDTIIEPKEDDITIIYVPRMLTKSEQVRLLAKQIDGRRKENIDGFDFVPYEWLLDLLTVEKILQVLHEGTIEKYEHQSIAEAVRESGLRTFATLVLIGEPDLIYKFKQVDTGFQRGSPDSRLPMKTLDLDGVIDVLPTKAAFLKLQFLFVIPTFPQGIPHRIYEDGIRLPFLKPPENPNTQKKRTPGGHFGFVSMEKLPPPAYGLSDELGMTLVRKMLKTKGDGAYQGELRCLRLLNAVRHSSILELSGSYTRCQAHNFLFPEATDGDLHDLLQKKNRPPQFRDDEAIYLAICGLASALEQLHYYSNDDLKVELLGCHHDLKPRNVLVHGERFILADFGLTRLTDSIEDLHQMAEDRDLYFDAPERMDYTAPVPIRRKIGPSSDIWSLGAIIAVIHAYMKGGPGEVEKFRDQRSFIYKPEKGKPGIFLKSFHNRGKPNQGVENWLSTEGRGRTAAEEELVSLIRDMLSIEPTERPDIRVVLLRLRCITLMKIAKPITEFLDQKPDRNEHSEPLEYAVERQVFLEWLQRVAEASKAPGLHFIHTDEMFSQVKNTVYAIRDEFRLLAEASRDDSPLFARLRRLNGQLLACLDEQTQRSIRTVAEFKVMPRAREIAKE